MKDEERTELILGARRLQSLSVRRVLTEAELQYGLMIMDKLIADERPHIAGWVFDALRRSERRYRTQGVRMTHARVADRLLTAAMRGPLTPAGAPHEYTISKLAPRVSRTEKRA